MLGNILPKQQENKPGNQKGLHTVGRENRITSYNVCYTKLLRILDFTNPLIHTFTDEIMLELRFVRENLELVRNKSLLRGVDPRLIDHFAEIDSRRLTALAETERNNFV